MPFFDPDADEVVTQDTGYFGYTHAPLNKFGASQQTLLSIAFDGSGSTINHRPVMVQMCKRIRAGCEKDCPQPDAMSMRVTRFGSSLQEIVGWNPVISIQEETFNSLLTGGGATALVDGGCDAAEAIRDFGAVLHDQNDADTNGIFVLITDGEGNCGKLQDPKEIRNRLDEIVASEKVESCLAILVRVNVKSPKYKQYLDNLNVVVKFDKDVEVETWDEDTIGKLCDWIVSISSSQSQALGSGAASVPIDPTF